MLLIGPDVHRDARGYFMETYHAEKYREAGIAETFVQDNHSFSVKGALRGLHAQVTRPQCKLVRVVEGEIFDVCVDLRRTSPTFGHWEGLTLSSENALQVYVPPGFAHGFCVLGKCAHVEYKCTEFYRPQDELSLRWDDPELGIDWPVVDPILSEKDRHAFLLRDLIERLIVADAAKGR